ncbi:MAG: 16S rRNA (guanine(966)-N(2))-methyltransferase RsmD [Clostridiales bacterium]|nr:16S rRNA (guanine(966)-N(2))-methyltransferase RsmD [Clostridiales bacterium]
MRVIAGKARSLQLKTIEGMDTRPTTGRIKETLFNMIQPYMADSRFLDLFAGSGAIGIEALSRGADCCVFVEKQKKAAACIRDNLKFTRLEGQARVLMTDVVSAIKKIDGEEPFQCIFMDPPYNQGLEMEALKALCGTSLVDEETMIIVEASLETDFRPVEEMGYEIVKEKRYKTNRHLFLKKGGKP